MGKIIMLVAIFSFVLAACNDPLLENASPSSGVNYPNITSNQKMISDKLLKQGKNSLEELIIFSTDYKYSISIADSFEIVERIDDGNMTFATYKFKNSSTQYFGAYFAWHENDKWYMLKSYEDSRNLDTAGDVAFMAGKVSVPIHPSKKIDYYVRFGYINDKNITRITLQYTDNTLSTIELGDKQDLFMDNYLQNKKVLQKVTMLDDSGKVIWKREWK